MYTLCLMINFHHFLEISRFQGEIIICLNNTLIVDKFNRKATGKIDKWNKSHHRLRTRFMLKFPIKASELNLRKLRMEFESIKLKL